MVCTSLLKDDELLAFIDGERDRRVVEHLEHCSYCRERANALATLQNYLATRLYRAICPSSLELGEYYLELLPPDQMRVVARHLRECPHCTQEIAQLVGYLADMGPGIVEQVKVLIARLVTQSDLSRQPTWAYARGSAGAGPLIYQVNNIQVVIQVQQDNIQPDRQKILGLIVGLDDEPEMEACLWRDERCVATTAIDEDNFVFSDLTPACYELILESPKMEIHIQNLQVTFDPG